MEKRIMGMMPNLNELNEKLLEMTEKNEFSGTAIVAKDGKTVFQGAYGYADRENDSLMDIYTKINIGSINKSFTAIGICQLQQMGKLSFDDAVEKYVPEMAELSQNKITIHHLLTHTAGLDNFKADAEYINNKHQIMTIGELLPYAIRPLISVPGGEHKYSNSGYVVLGAVIEQIGGMDYYDYMEKNIYNPAEMVNTGHFLQADDVLNRAKGYMIMENGSLAANTDLLPLRGGSAGGGYSTVPDMLQYMNALKNDIFIKNTFDTISKKGAHYWYGTARFPSGAIGHTGGAGGINGYYGVHPETGFSATVLSNVDMGAMRAMRVINIHFGLMPQHDGSVPQGTPGMRRTRK